MFAMKPDGTVYDATLVHITGARPEKKGKGTVSASVAKGKKAKKKQSKPAFSASKLMS